jgi:hypothetical protein
LPNKTINKSLLFIICLIEYVEKLECGKHLHDRIISLKGEVCANKTSLTPPLCIEVSVPSQECERKTKAGYQNETCTITRE